MSGALRVGQGGRSGGGRMSSSKDTIYMGKRFNWDEFDRVRKSIWYLVKREGLKRIVLDFKRSEIIYPNGMVPLIALVKTYQQSGVSFSINPPVSVDLNRLIRFEGWFYAIDPSHFGEPANSGYNSLPLRQYANDDELNASVNEAIEVAIRNLTMAKNVPDALEWCLNELAGNVLHHAETGEGYLQVNTFKSSGNLSLIVVDAGVGVPSSMRARFHELRNDRIALEQAIQKGVTSKPNFGQGNGLAGCVAITLASSGQFALTSGGARVTVSEGRVAVRDFFPPLAGTVVELQLPISEEIDLPTALWGHSPSSYLEEKFSDEAANLCLRLSECAPTFGNRVTGEKVRNIIQNLLVSNPSSSLEIDFSDVKIVASSFADEVFGKLFLILGPLEFGSRIRYVSVNGTCKQIINTAIKERAAQGLIEI